MPEIPSPESPATSDSLAQQIAPVPSAQFPAYDAFGPTAVLAILSISFAGVALLISLVPPVSFITFLFAIPAIVVGIVALARRAPRRRLARAGVAVAGAAWFISLLIMSATIYRA